MSSVEEEDLPYVGILQSVLGIIDTKHYDYGTLFNEINVNTGGIGTSLEPVSYTHLDVYKRQVLLCGRI